MAAGAGTVATGAVAVVVAARVSHTAVILCMRLCCSTVLLLVCALITSERSMRAPCL